MIDLDAFINALKFTWIRRILKGNLKFINIMKCYYDIYKIAFGGSDYHKDSHRYKNRFWTDVFHGLNELNKKEKPKTWSDIFTSCIWNNPFFKIGNKLYQFDRWIVKKYFCFRPTKNKCNILFI